MNVHRWIAATWLASSTLLGVSREAPAQQATTTAEAAPPVETYFRRPSYGRVSLSPDGKSLVAFVPLNDRRNLALIDIEQHTAVALTSMTEYDVESYQWRGDKLLEIRTANLADAGGLVRLKADVLIDTAGNLVRDLRTASRRGGTEVIATLDRAGDDLVIQNFDRNATGLDAYRYNPRTGEKRLLTFRSPGDVTRYVADRSGQIRVAVSVRRGGKRQVLSYRKSNDDEWTSLRDEAVEDVSIEPIGFDFEGRVLYVYAANRERGGLQDVYAFDPETNTLGDRLWQAQDRDLGGLVFDEIKRKPVGVRDASPGGVHWLDPEWARLQQAIDQALPDTDNVITWARFDPSKLVVTSQSRTQPPVFYLLDHATLKMEEIAVAYPWLKPADLSPREFVRYRARDGLSIPAYLTAPRRPAAAKPPLIVDIHGGPFVGRQTAAFDPDAQFFASRGYMVLQPDFRGTLGYGESFHQAGWKQWGLAMQDDITDGVQWLIDAGKVDPDRVCLFGASYGGYATLWGLEKEPGMFRCGVAFVAVSDLELLFDVTWSDTQRYDRDDSNTNFLARTLGDPQRDRAKMQAVSPLYHADRLAAPVLLAYGGSDVRVPIIHGQRLRSALERNGKAYEWVVYDDEGHGFNKEANLYDFYRRVDAFLAKNLAPRAAAAPGD